MNKEKILKLADFIEKSNSFSMHWPFWTNPDRAMYMEGVENTEEGCPASILGHIRVLEGYLPWDESLDAKVFFGIPAKEINRILWPTYYPSKVYFRSRPGCNTYITKNMAIQMLENLLLTKKVRWKRWV